MLLIMISHRKRSGVRRVFTFDAFGFRIQGLGFAAQSLSGSINPNIHGLDFIALGELHVLLLDSFTQRGAGGCRHITSYYSTPEEKKRSRRETTTRSGVTCILTRRKQTLSRYPAVREGKRVPSFLHFGNKREPPAQTRLTLWSQRTKEGATRTTDAGKQTHCCLSCCDALDPVVVATSLLRG